MRAIGGGAFSECALTGGIVCGDGCSFRALEGLVLSDDLRICFSSYGVLSSVCVPDGVRELCDGCFKGCWSLRRVTFGPSSSLERIGVEAFGAVQLFDQDTPCAFEEISIPDSVRELCDGCFKGCSSLRRVTFGPSSSLERIGVEAFGAVRPEGFGQSTPCGLEEISIPDGVRELCDGCFKGCSSLRRVTFGPSSSLERIGFHALPRSVASYA